MHVCNVLWSLLRGKSVFQIYLRFTCPLVKILQANKACRQLDIPASPRLRAAYRPSCHPTLQLPSCSLIRAGRAAHKPLTMRQGCVVSVRQRHTCRPTSSNWGVRGNQSAS